MRRVIGVEDGPGWDEIIPLDEESRALGAVLVYGTIDETEQLFEIAVDLCIAPNLPSTGVVIASEIAFTDGLPEGSTLVEMAGLPNGTEDRLFLYDGGDDLRRLLERAWNGWSAPVAAYPIDDAIIPPLPEALDLEAARAIVRAAVFSVACGNDAQTVVVIPRQWERRRVLDLVREVVNRSR